MPIGAWLAVFLALAWASPVSAIHYGWNHTCNITDTFPPIHYDGYDTDEILALARLYSSLGGSNWTKRTHWFNPDPSHGPCDDPPWHGITCVSSPNVSHISKISSIHLPANNLCGNYSYGILEGFGDIQSLDLSNNYINGTFPVFELSRTLKHLFISGTNASARFEDFVNHAPQIVQLAVAQCWISGTIPNDIDKKMTNLGLLFAEDNWITGTLPEELGNINSLIVIDISANNLTGTLPSLIAELPHLFELDLSWNSLSGTLPERWLGQDTRGGNSVVQAQTIELNNNKFSGSIPAQLMGRFVDVSANNFSGEFPNVIWGCGGWARVYNASENPYLRGPVPAQLQVNQIMYPTNKVCGQIVCPEDWGGFDILVDSTYNESLSCNCASGYFGLPSGNCFPCDSWYSSCNCSGTVVQRCWPIVNTTSNNTLAIVGCPIQQNKEFTCNPKGNNWSPDFASNGQWCQAGYEGRFCSKCEKNYYLLGRQCVSCNVNFRPVFYPFMFASFVVLVLISVLLASGEKISGVLKIFAFYVQTLGLVFGERYGLSAQVNEALQIIASTAVLSFSSIHLECYNGISFAAKVVIDMAMPGFYCVFAAVMYMCGWVYHTFSKKEESERWFLHWKEKCFSSLITLMLLYYFPITYFAMRSFACTVQDTVTQIRYLNYQPWIACTWSDHTFFSIFWFAAFALVVYVIGFPLLLFRFVYLNISDRDNIATRIILAPVVGCYRQGFHYWEFVTFLRRVVMSIAISVPSYNSSSIIQHGPAIISLTAVIGFQFKYQPFSNRLVNILEMTCLVLLLVTYAATVYLDFNNVSQEAISYTVLAINMPMTGLLIGMVLLMVLYKKCVAVHGHANVQEEEQRLKEADSAVPIPSWY